MVFHVIFPATGRIYHVDLHTRHLGIPPASTCNIVPWDQWRPVVSAWWLSVGLREHHARDSGGIKPELDCIRPKLISLAREINFVIWSIYEQLSYQRFS